MQDDWEYSVSEHGTALSNWRVVGGGVQGQRERPV